MALSSIFAIPRPKSFLWIMSLRTGTQLTLTTLIINKITGLYGLLAIFTGLHLSPLQFSMYIYSLMALGLSVYLAPFIRKQAPLQCLGLAWFYILDSIINALYTAAFGMTWFIVIAEHNAPAPGGQTMKDTGGFANPKYDVDRVEVSASGEHVGINDNDIERRATVPAGGLGDAILQSGSIASISVIVALWLIRLYFILVVMAYARAVLRQHIVTASWQSTDEQPISDSASEKFAANPFAEGKEQGTGWSGKLGRIMLSVGKSYWLGVDDDSSWAQALGPKDRRPSGAHGTSEREARRRTGTGPPEMSRNLQHEMKSLRSSVNGS